MNVRSWRSPSTAGIIALLLVAGGCAGTDGGDAGPATGSLEREIAVAGRQQFRIGRYEAAIGADDTLAALDRVFGVRDGCRKDAQGYRADWPDAGIAAELQAAGALQPNVPACVQSPDLQVEEVRLTGRSWRTDVGLQVGDRAAALLRDYPIAHADQRHSGEVLLVAAGADERSFPSGTELAARVEHDKVAELIVRLDR